jgi:anaerobic magnesium-protoporphyrin IX monomethyl ester cyclase
LYQLVTALRKAKDVSSVAGLVIRDGNKIISTGQGEYIQDLSALPAIPYDLFPENQWLPIGRWYAAHHPQPHWRFDDRVINVHGGRGCPFKCNFCYHHSKPRYRKIPLMIAEGAEALNRFKGNMLYFSDDLVLATPKRAKALVAAIRSLNKPIEYSVSARFDILAKLDDQLLHELKETGCRIMGLGIESGSNRILKIIGKNCTAESILEGLERLKIAGILPTVSIMVGQSTETKEDVEASIDVMRKSVRSNPNIEYAFTIATPFPGSELYNHIFEKDYLRNDEQFYNLYFASSNEWQQVVNLSAMSDEEVITMYNKIRKVYRQEKSNALGRKVLMIRKLQIILGDMSRIFDNIIVRQLFNLDQSSRLSKGYHLICDFTLPKLDRYRLKLQRIH